MMGQCMEMMMGGMMGGGMLWPLISSLVIIGLLVGGAVLLVRSLTAQRGGSGGNALAILQERFARGELDAEEYQERRRLLQGQP